MSTFFHSTSGIIQFDTRTLTSVSNGQYLKVDRDAAAYTNVKGGTGDSAYLANIDATKFTITLSLFKGSDDARFLLDIYNENLRAMVAKDYETLAKTHTLYAKSATNTFSGSNIKISNAATPLAMDAQNSNADEVVKMIFTLICPDGFLI